MNIAIKLVCLVSHVVARDVVQSLDRIVKAKEFRGCTCENWSLILW